MTGLQAVEASEVTPGVLGFLVVAALGVATYLLIRSMNRQLGRIDLPDEPAEGSGSTGGADGADDRGGAVDGDEPRG